MRTFIAIELSKEIQDTLGELESQLRKSGADVKWVKPDNIHLTLKFLGEIEPKNTEEIKQALADIAKGLVPFKMRLTNLGAFPKINYPRVIWVDIEEGKQILLKISKELEDRLSKIGIDRQDKPFKAHITIGRVRSGQNRNQLVDEMQKFKSPLNAEYTVDKITFYKSTLTGSGPIYEVIYEVHLQKN